MSVLKKYKLYVGRLLAQAWLIVKDTRTFRAQRVSARCAGAVND
jgi:hypothetical protein